ncbi:MAG: acyl-CoA carboxylase subunit beta, partial [Acidobacteria bacterium]|nr:acyl-CoA carboxylase subunit beta [Acidobacteriota bacterium]
CVLDPGSFDEEFMLGETAAREFGMAEKRKPTDGVVIGRGRIEGRPVYAYAQDRTVLAGSVGALHAERIAYATDRGRQWGIPVIGLLESAGARIQEGLDVTRAIGKIFRSNTLASGVVPQISAIMGACFGVASYSPALTDFVLMVKGKSQMFITSPSVIKEVLGEEVTLEELGGSKVHSEVSGVADLVAASDAECLEQVRRLLSFLPSNWRERPPRRPSKDDPQRKLEGIQDLVPRELRQAYDVEKLIRAMVDDGEFLPLKPKFARNIVTGFGRLGGHSVGFVANQPLFLAGSLDVDSADKAARFIRFCDAFNIPIITLVDVPGFLPGKKQEEKGIIRHGAKMLYAYAESTVPKITLYLRKGYGGAKQAMCTQELGADFLFVWPEVELAVMGAEAAVGVLYKKEIEGAEDPEEVRRQKIQEYQQRFRGPFEALARQFAHAVIRPEETRSRLIRALEDLLSKEEDRIPKKHGVMPV